MSDNDQQVDTDLLQGSQEPDTSADAGATEENTMLLDSTETQIEAPKGDKPVKSSAEVQRQKQVDAWVAKGPDALSMLPKDKEWLRPHIEAAFKLKQAEPDIKKAVQEELAKERVEAKYASQKEMLLSMKLKRDQLEKVQIRQDQLLARGVPKDEALEIAAEAAGISLDPEDVQVLQNRKRMALPHQGTMPIVDQDAKPEDPDFHRKVTDPKKKMQILMQSLRASS